LFIIGEQDANPKKEEKEMPHLSCCLPVPGPGSVTVGLLATQVSQLARATMVSSRQTRRESRRGQGKVVRRLILTELESQERSYVESMKILVHDYLEPLEQAGPRVSSCELLCQLSCCVREILEIHTKLLEQLEVVRGRWDEVEVLGELMTKTLSDVNVFNIYSGYVNNLAELQKNFKQEAESNQDFARFLKETGSRLGSNLDWFSLSLKPVQKLPQLKMLLERLLKKTPRDHPDRSAQRESIQVLERLLVGINEGRREKERQEKEKEGRGRGELLTRLARVVRIR